MQGCQAVPDYPGHHHHTPSGWSGPQARNEAGACAQGENSDRGENVLHFCGWKTSFRAAISFYLRFIPRSTFQTQLVVE